jgi:hypothetical protein
VWCAIRGNKLNSRFKLLTLATAITVIVGGLTACKPRNEPVIDEQAPQQAVVESAIPTIQAKVVVESVPSPKVCDATGCMEYRIQTVDTNIDWINDYFKDRIKALEPNAFKIQELEKVEFADPAKAGLSQSSTVVRYISQFGNIATFAIDSYSYMSGAAHGMYHTEYVNFDLKNKKRLSFEDIVLKGHERKVLDQLYASNSIWLENHVIERGKLQLSDNFYYGVNGIVFVYPLYELASYSEGMSELTLSYRKAKPLFNPQFMPSLPKYSQ